MNNWSDLVCPWTVVMDSMQDQFDSMRYAARAAAEYRYTVTNPNQINYTIVP